VEGDVRIGTFICDCGDEISTLLDLKKLEKKVEAFPGVALVRRLRYPCSKDGLREIGDAIQAKTIDRVVVAGCSPRIYGPVFRSACEKAGLDGSMFEMVNIRDQCCRVHPGLREKATEKAERLVGMAVAKSVQSVPREKIEVKVSPSALVVGGGISGMTAALSLATKGVKVKLVERDKKLGGILNQLHKLSPSGVDSGEVLKSTGQKVRADENIQVFTSAEVTSVSGAAGDYRVHVIQKGKGLELGAGAIVVATGADVLKPEGMYDYDGKSVITQLDLEGLLKEGKVNDKNVVMVQCVGARQPGREYCSRTCCMTAIKNSILLKECSPSIKVSLLFRDLQTFGRFLEKDILKARDMGVNFVRYQPPDIPQVNEGLVKVSDRLSGKDVEIPYDLLVLSTPLIPSSGAKELVEMIGVTADKDGFIPEEHVMLRPNRFVSGAVYPCGCTHWPATVSESIYQAYLAAAKAGQFLLKESITADCAVPGVVEERCRACGWCEEACEFGAIEMKEIEGGQRVARISPVTCKGCDLCVVTCPCGAIVPTAYTTKQIEAMVEALA